VIEILIVQSLAWHMQGDIPAALIPLEQALTLAEPEGYVRIFAGEGSPMTSLLNEALKQEITPSYVRRLIESIDMANGRLHGKPPKVSETLSEPLSIRERDVLRMLASDLSGPDIARELMVSLNTLRTHTKNIYDKLQVNNRRSAVRRAEELDLI